MRRWRHYEGERFGRITVLKRVDDDLSRHTRWMCRCDCGNEWIMVSSNMRKNYECKKCASKSQSLRQITHGDTHTRLYGIYRNMIERCTNPKNISYKNYGARGITLCNIWLGKGGYERFKTWALSHGYREDLTIERKNVNDGYSPDNCTWITLEEQSHNKRNSAMYTFNGKTQDTALWAKEYGINYCTLKSRLRRGISIEKALLTPIKENNHAKQMQVFSDFKK